METPKNTYKIGKIRTDQRVLLESGKAFHPILRYTGIASDEVAGTVFKLSREEITRADDYQRVRAVLKSGRSCWIYAASGL